MLSSSPIRRPYHGSCHCGLTKYIIFLTLPPGNTPSTTRIYKCNCTICHKMSFLHANPASPHEDFLVLSPEDPLSSGELGDYTCGTGRDHWLFCRRCGVRCFGLAGVGETVEVDLGEVLGGENEGRLTRVWRVKEEEEVYTYVSVNATTLEPGQEGLDLREWTEKGWIMYGAKLKDMKAEDKREPSEGGMW